MAESATCGRTDTAMCRHLQYYLSIDRDLVSKSAVKIEVNEYGQAAPVTSPSSASSGNARLLDMEKRFVQVVQWGAKAQGVKRRRVCAPDCDSCKTPLPRPWACFTCPFVGCLSLHASTSTSNSCMNNHWTESKDQCGFAVDAASGAIFCAQCSDTTYPDTFDTLYRATLIRIEEASDPSREYSVTGKGKIRGNYKPWLAPKEVIGVGTQASCRGLRPLLNLSQTCFLSAILQALAHNPLLKAYFLSDKHNRHVCNNGSRGLAVGKPYIGPMGNVSDDRDKGCMCCEMDRAFEEFHSEDKTPFGPITMLYSMWHASAELEGYGQQALDQIHAHARGQLSSCNCIAHQTFAGSLLSSVTCSRCKTSSTTIDPILDIQLDFPPDPSNGEPLTLIHMLRRFCAEEKVGDPTKGYDCSKCGGGAGAIASRMLRIKRLPPVLSFQLKRFAHNATSTKVELPVSFPSQLNMRAFVEAPPPGAESLPASLYDYDLFAVVTHEGKLDNGHYWADVLSGEQWWHCDDDKVTPTTLKDVLAQKAYMLFYVKRSLVYAQAPNKPSGVVNPTTNGSVANHNAMLDKNPNDHADRGGSQRPGVSSA